MSKKTFIMLLMAAFSSEIAFSQAGGNTRKVMVTFQLDLSSEIKNVMSPFSIGIRGNTPPLSWDKTYPMTDKDRNGIYEATIPFEISGTALSLEFKYFHDRDKWENTGNRVISVKDEKMLLPIDTWNTGPPSTYVDPAHKDSIAKSLYREIRMMDSLLFNTFNTRDLEKLMSFFTEDLEFYHDISGLTNYTQNKEAFKENFAKNNGLRRELVKGSLEVYPVKDYGAMEIGAHTFCHLENGKQDCGTFKFVMIWRKKDGQWKISRVVSYDH